MPILQAFHEEYGDRVAVLGHRLGRHASRGRRWSSWRERGVTYPQLADPGGDLQDTDTFARVRGYPYLAFVDADGRDRLREVRRPSSRPTELEGLVEEHLGVEPVTDRHPGLPDWLRPVEDAARSITVHDLTRFMPPEDAETRESAVLMLFGEHPDHGPDLLLTERSHTHALPPGPGVLPRRHHRPGRDRRAGRAARGAGGDRPRPGRRRRLRRAAAAVDPAERVLGHPRARLVARVQPVDAWSRPTRCTPSTGSRSPSCATPRTGSWSRARSRAGAARAS